MEFSPNSFAAPESDNISAEMAQHRVEIRNDYPTPESVVDAYRNGMVDGGFLELGFSAEEIEVIHAEAERRNQVEKSSSLK